MDEVHVIRLLVTEIQSFLLSANNLNFLDGQPIKNSNSSWFCLRRSYNIFSFINITNKQLQLVFVNKEYHVDDYIDNSIKTCILLKPQENLTNLNNLSSDQNNKTESIIKSKCYDIDEIQTLNKLKCKHTLSLFHINPCSLSKIFEDIEYLLNTISINFDVVARCYYQ